MNVISNIGIDNFGPGYKKFKYNDNSIYFAINLLYSCVQGLVSRAKLSLK